MVEGILILGRQLMLIRNPVQRWVKLLRILANKVWHQFLEREFLIFIDVIIF